MTATSNALAGHTGFVGSTLMKQAHFDRAFRSHDIAEIGQGIFDTVVCAAAPGQKWLANREPEADCASIDRLISHLRTVHCKTFVLISTVDVFSIPVGVNEDTPVDEDGLHPYGLHRRLLERFVESHFDRHLIVRLPGLVGPGLRKNVVYDLQHGNNVAGIDSRGVFQFYPMVNLWWDIQAALQAGLRLVHLTAEPISVTDVALEGFGRPLDQHQPHPPGRYDLRSRHAALFGASGPYQYTRRETLQAVRAYAQSEPVASVIV